MKYFVFAFLLFTCCAAIGQPLPTSTPKFYLIGMISDEITPYVREYLAANPEAELIISSPGGFRPASEEIADMVAKHGNVRCVVRDQARSGAFAILQACRLRSMLVTARLGTHEPRLNVPGAIERTLAVHILATLEATSGSWNARCRARLRMTAAEYEAKVKGKDWVLTATEALQVGAVDQVLR